MKECFSLILFTKELNLIILLKSRLYNFIQEVLTKSLLKKGDFTKKRVLTSLIIKRKFQFNSKIIKSFFF